MFRASKSITLLLIGSIGVLWGFKSWLGNEEDYASTTQPSGSSSFWGHNYHSSSRGWSSSSSSHFGSSSSSVHSSGTSRGGFGSSGASHAGS